MNAVLWLLLKVSSYVPPIMMFFMLEIYDYGFGFGWVCGGGVSEMAWVSHVVLGVGMEFV